MPNLNRVLLNDSAVSGYVSGKSIDDVAAEFGVSYSKARAYLIKRGVALRTPAQGTKLAGWKIGEALRGRIKAPFTEEHRLNISKARFGRGAGISHKTGRYVQFTMGKNKGRGQHVAIMEAIIGRRINRDEVVHHIDENKHNNSPDNLQLMTRSEHSKLHAKLRHAKS